MATQKKKDDQRFSKRSQTKKVKSRQTSKNKYEAIVQRLNPISESKIVTEYKKLTQLSCKDVYGLSSHTRLGNSIVDYFTMVERLHTTGHKNISFYQFWEQRKKYKKVPHIRKRLTFYNTRMIDELRKFKYIYNLYFSSITIFKPVLAMEIYCRVEAKRILDFTMGWGGRLVGACALNLEAYIGIELNAHLQEPYKKMKSFLRQQNTTTKNDLRFQDALKINYDLLDYDTVFTSPPYYDLEKYRGAKDGLDTKEKWFESFYKPIYEKTWNGLKSRGHYCLNVPQEIYEHTCIPVLGKCHQQFLLKKKDRKESAQYKEYIYVWKKP